MTINDRISEVMKYSGLSPADFSEKIDVQRSSISHIMSGRNKPSLDFIVKIKNTFPEINWDWLINGEGQMLENANRPAGATASLFNLIDEDEIKDYSFPLENLKPRESVKPAVASASSLLHDSQPLEDKVSKTHPLSVENEIRSLKKIVFFYTDGKFEVFEP